MAIKLTKRVSKRMYKSLVEANEIANIERCPELLINTDKIIYSLAKKYNLPFNTIENIVNSQFSLTKKLLTEEEDYPHIKLSYLGRFYVRQYKRKFKEILKQYGRE